MTWHEPQPFSEPGRPPRRSRGATAVAVGALGLVAALAGAGIGHRLWTTSPSVNQTVADRSSPVSLGGSNGGSVAADVRSALVDINVTEAGGEGAGTGIVLSSSGEVLTNNHVIAGATSISVTDVGNGKTYDATVVGYDESHDVAVIQLRDASGLQTAKLGDSAAAAVGDAVTAIGNAGGTGGTPTSASGSITGLGQTITASDALDGTSEQLSGLIQTDADVQPGDSGGALVDSSGAVIGINTAASQGYSFDSAGGGGYAVPIGRALAVARQIESGDGTSVVHVGPTAFLGVQISSTGDQSGGYYGYGGGSAAQGAAVSGVVDGTPAQQAGLAQGDVITSLDDQPVTSSTDLTGILVGHHPGDDVTLGWVDSTGQTRTATVHLATGAPA